MVGLWVAAEVVLLYLWYEEVLLSESFHCKYTFR